MSYERLNLEDGQVLTAANLAHIEDGIEEAAQTGGSGGSASAEDIPNLYIWKKYTTGAISEEEQDSVMILYKSSTESSHASIDYADSVTEADGALALVDPVTIEAPTLSVLRNTILGKYIYSHDTGAYLYVPSDASITQSGSSTVGTSIYVAPATVLTVGDGTSEFLKYVASESSDAYPTEGVHTDGYWYVYYKQLAECVNEGSTDALPMPPTAEVGQYIRVAAVDEEGKVTATEAVDIEVTSLPDAEEASF